MERNGFNGFYGNRSFVVGLLILLVACFAMSGLTQPVWADEISREDELVQLRQLSQDLLKRIELLESEQTRQKKQIEKKPDVSVPYKVSGRAAFGYIDTTGKRASGNRGSFEVPDAKLQFTYQPDTINTVVMRFDLGGNTAKSPLLDYFYLQSKDLLPFASFKLPGRFGRFKLNFGEETVYDNVVQSPVISNSAARATAVDEGIEFADKRTFGSNGDKEFGWAVSASNGQKGSSTTNPKAVMGKLHYSPSRALYLSASYYDARAIASGTAVTPSLNLASMNSMTGSINSWSRTAWEVDARYDFRRGKKALTPPAYTDSKAYISASYGGFTDAADAAIPDRSGKFGFVEALCNLSSDVYVAGRMSFIELDDDRLAGLNGVNANKYNRNTLAIGYRTSDRSILKLGYDWNRVSGAGVGDAPDTVSLMSVHTF